MDQLTASLNILSAITLIGAVVFAALQVRAANRTRSEQAALAIINAIHSDAWTHSLGMLGRIPKGASAEEIDSLGPEVEQAIADYGLRLETVGYISRHRQHADDRRDDRWRHGRDVDQHRAVGHAGPRTHRPRQYEWFQWGGTIDGAATERQSSAGLCAPRELETVRCASVGLIRDMYDFRRSGQRNLN
jgi:hypothetical protein